jgi:translation initiation factor IF-1
MRLKSTDLGQMGGNGCGKRLGGLSDRLVEGTLKFGGGSLMVWGCMLWDGVRYACKIDGKMDRDLYIKILEEDLQESISYYQKSTGDVIF